MSHQIKHLQLENEFKKLHIFDSCYFIGQSYFDKDGPQLYLIFPTIYKTITTFPDVPNTISEC